MTDASPAPLPGHPAGLDEEVIFVKLGGSLITDKGQAETARPEVIAGLAEELAAALSERPAHVVLGHGSGSFGHVAAHRHGLRDGLRRDEQRSGVSETQGLAAALHRRVVGALETAGAHPFSLAPSSFMVCEERSVVEVFTEPLVHSLDHGLLPTVYGDVVLDRRQGIAICSTETIFMALATTLPRWGKTPVRALWLGETAGVLDHADRLLPELTPGTLPSSLAGASGTDVTGGMEHRVRSAFELARRGVESLIFDGRVAGHLTRALRGEPIPGTRIPALDLS
ncbi:MAG: isopentenyl phosphate kinase [Acidobacteriota bacterium]